MKKAHKPKRIRILVADREEVFRLGVRQLFSLEDDLRVVAQATTSEQVASLAERFRPHVLMVQGEIAAESPGNFMEQLRRVSPRSKLVITTPTLEGDTASRYTKAGAAGVIARSAALSQFLSCIREAMEQKTGMVRATGAGMVKTAAAPQKAHARPADTLTRREKAVISCLMQGFPNREIARCLSMAEQTVKNHLRAIFDKVGVSDRLELVLYAIHQKLELPLIEAVQEQASGPVSSA
jgi:DNA-binding NarL/FixJ family response regulator